GRGPRHVARASVGSYAAESAWLRGQQAVRAKHLPRIDYHYREPNQQLLRPDSRPHDSSASILEYVHFGSRGPTFFVGRGHAADRAQVFEFPRAVDFDIVILVAGGDPQLTVVFAEGEGPEEI